jgi:hypothetical protein
VRAGVCAECMIEALARALTRELENPLDVVVACVLSEPEHSLPPRRNIAFAISC